MTISEMIASGCKGKPIMGAWSMKRKRNPLGVIVKHKARLCAHGGQTIEGVHYESTHAPVVTWTAIRFLLTASLINNWHTRQIDFVLAHPQAKVSHDVCVLPPEKFEIRDGNVVLRGACLHEARVFCQAGGLRLSIDRLLNPKA